MGDVTGGRGGRDSVSALEEAIAFNVRVRLAAKGRSQSDLAGALGIKRAAMSQKMRGRTGWSAADVVNAADFLDTDPNSLLETTMLRLLREGRGGDGAVR